MRILVELDHYTEFRTRHGGTASATQLMFLQRMRAVAADTINIEGIGAHALGAILDTFPPGGPWINIAQSLMRVAYEPRLRRLLGLRDRTARSARPAPSRPWRTYSSTTTSSSTRLRTA